jgi:hypothetical protein
MITKDTIDEIYRVAIIEDVINDFVLLYHSIHFV